MAVQNADLTVDAGCVTGLIGPNGAGKTTLFNAICGLQPMVAGRVLLDGTDVSGLPPHRRARLGLARTFQKLELFGSLTVRENLQVAAEYRARLSPESVDPRVQVDDAIDFVGLDDVADVRADELSTGRARQVELGRALVTRPRVLLLDEPASGLDDAETADLADNVGALAEAGMAVLLVDHDVSLVMATCARIHVLDFGRIISVGTPEEIQADEKVLEAYLGTKSVA
jgi:branched-chain amino acid transport system ATP-binding protein